jgi:hypothetical protein
VARPERAPELADETTDLFAREVPGPKEAEDFVDDREGAQPHGRPTTPR